MIKQVLAAAKKYLKSSEIKKIEKAYNFAVQAHVGQKRLSGEDYIVHPAAVALILTQLNQGVETICAAFLHDVVEDTKITIEDIKKEFGEATALLVEGVTKLTNIKLKEEDTHKENVRKMFLAMAKDIRIVFIKLADRLHNMRTLEYLAADKRISIAKETLDIYAPLAHRLGLGLIKNEMEDIAFRYLEPEEYQMMKKKVSLKIKERQRYLEKFKAEVEKLMAQYEIKGAVTGRSKHFYSIYRKMKTQSLGFDEIFDLWAIRILLNSEQECYAMLGQIHAVWKPVPGKIKDYIAMPKTNMYQSLHTTVIGPEGRPVEIQIRTFKMHEIAEYGVASHWLYKESDKEKIYKKKTSQKEAEYISKMTWLRQLTEEAEDSRDFIESLKTDLLFGEVYVFSPKGDVYSLTEGSTPLDFAYLVHTDVGHRCIGAKINNKIVPLDTPIKNGDIVEILTKKGSAPKSDWLAIVKTNRARDKIKAWIYKQRKQDHLEAGKNSLTAALKEFFLDANEMLKGEYLNKVLKHYSFLKEEELFIAIGKGDIAAKAVARFFHSLYQDEHQKKEPEKLSIRGARADKFKKSKNTSGVSVHGMDSIMLKLAHCCYPLPGDSIVGYVTMGYGITVHRESCSNVLKSQERRIEVYWTEDCHNNKYQATLEVLGFDRVGIFKDILDVIAGKDTNVVEARANKKGNSEIKAKIVIEVSKLEQANTIISALKNVRDVYDAYRKMS